MSDEQRIRDGERIRQFLTDEVVKGRFEALEAKYVEEWKVGETPAAREAAWAKVRALGDVRLELNVVVDAGILAAVRKARDERKPGR